MKYLIIYDITDDNLRNQVAETLKDYGLERIQYSAFTGHLTRNKLNSLLTDLRKLVTQEGDNIKIYPICQTCSRGVKEVGSSRYRTAERKKVAFI